MKQRKKTKIYWSDFFADLQLVILSVVLMDIINPPTSTHFNIFVFVSGILFVSAILILRSMKEVEK